jgi:hypothetical protein
MCVLIFSTRFSEIFLIPRRTERDMMKNAYWSACKVPIVTVRYQMKLEFSPQIFAKYLNIKYHGNLFSSSRVVTASVV